MAYIRKTLVYSNNRILTFNNNNEWISVNTSIENLTINSFLLNGFDSSVLTVPLSCVYKDMELTSSDDSCNIFSSNDIDKVIGIKSISYEVINEQNKIKLEVPTFLPKDYISNTDKLLFYTDDPSYVPEITSVTFSSSQTHNQQVVMNVKALYLYNKNIKYRLSIGNHYVSNWSSSISVLDDISININYTDLKVGMNDIKIEISDETNTFIGTQIIKDAIILYDNAPNAIVINADSNSFKVHFMVTDIDPGDSLQYQLTLINSKGSTVAVPWTELAISPLDIYYTFDSNLIVINEENQLKIEYKDNYGQGSHLVYTFVGEYKNLLFVDEYHEYYTTDKGAILKLLHFNKLIAGQTSQIKKITLKNNNETAINNLSLSTSTKNSIKDIYIELSKSNNPFTPSSQLDYGQEVMGFKDNKDFYIRIRSGIEAIGLEEFIIDAIAEPIS